MTLRGIWALAVCALAVAGTAGARPPLLPFSRGDRLSTDHEEVYVFQTQRTDRVRGSTPDCAAARFESATEDHFVLWSLNLSPRSARVKAAEVKQVGEFRACFGATTSGRPFGMYATGTLGEIPWSGYGECSTVTAQPPEPKVRAYTCNLVIDGLPEGYAGGWFTSSTVSPVLGAGMPANTRVPGFLSTSIVTMRLWRTPAEHP